MVTEPRIGKQVPHLTRLPVCCLDMKMKSKHFPSSLPSSEIFSDNKIFQMIVAPP